MKHGPARRQMKHLKALKRLRAAVIGKKHAAQRGGMPLRGKPIAPDEGCVHG
jgi:hypothetical protein